MFLLLFRSTDILNQIFMLNRLLFTILTCFVFCSKEFLYFINLEELNLVYELNYLKFKFLFKMILHMIANC
jgi:hypothetical protein